MNFIFSDGTKKKITKDEFRSLILENKKPKKPKNEKEVEPMKKTVLPPVLSSADKKTEKRHLFNLITQSLEQIEIPIVKNDGKELIVRLPLSDYSIKITQKKERIVDND